MSPNHFNSLDEAPSFEVGDLVRIKGGFECFEVLELTDGGRTVILSGDALESQHTGLEPKPIEGCDTIRTPSGELKGPVVNTCEEFVYVIRPDGAKEALKISECRATMKQNSLAPPRERRLFEIQNDLRKVDSDSKALQARRRALKKEAFAAFLKANHEDLEESGSK